MIAADFPLVSVHPIDAKALALDCRDLAAGALVVFEGIVRNHHKGDSVEFLEYTSHEGLAAILISQILAEASVKYSLQRARAVHRIGRLYPGETAVVVVTASAHRKEAYDANEEIIHRIKHEVPVWKKEFLSDGTSRWGMCDHTGVL
jgi:molybdopterin synthase catalytic subunit